MAFKEHFRELIERGFVYVACPPKYRITVNNKNIHFKNDKEYDSYKARYVSKRYKITNDNLSMLSVIKKSEDFKLIFNMLKNKYSIPSDILSMILSSDTMLSVAEYLDEQGLEVTEIGDDEFYVQGLLENDWLDLNIDKPMVNEIMQLKDIYGYCTFDMEDLKEKVTYECDIIDAIELIDKEFKFIRYRYKGLGETHPADLAETTLCKDTRDIIKIKIEDIEGATNMNKVLFGNNPDLRKDFIQENLNNLISN